MVKVKFYETDLGKMKEAFNLVDKVKNWYAPLSQNECNEISTHFGEFNGMIIAFQKDYQNHDGSYKISIKPSEIAKETSFIITSKNPLYESAKNLYDRIKIRDNKS